jgi:hypothetical protein
MSAQDDAEREHEHSDHGHRRKPTPAVEAAPISGWDGGQSDTERLASSIGNQNFGAVLARMSDGQGILDNGTVHPHVQAAIAAASGGGRSLDTAVAQKLNPVIGDVSDARIHTGPTANALARAVSARAFTVGRDVFFADNEFNPHTNEGLQLAAHELTHVQQQRNAPAAGPLTVSQPGDALEREADGVSSAFG